MFKSKRTLVNIAIFVPFVCIPFVPWYIPFSFAIVASWYYSYYEFILLGFLMDVFFASSRAGIFVGERAEGLNLLYAAGVPSFIHTVFFTLISASIVFILQMIKKRVRFYS